MTGIILQFPLLELYKTMPVMPYTLRDDIVERAAEKLCVDETQA